MRSLGASTFEMVFSPLASHFSNPIKTLTFRDVRINLFILIQSGSALAVTSDSIFSF